MRGEQLTLVRMIVSGKGPSPRARGAHLRSPVGAGQQGLIPACAGSTVTDDARSVPARAHPRVRGEHNAGSGNMLCWTGSSPRARGARQPQALTRVRPGLIPACAGSTGAQGCSVCGRGAHPRVRGEHVLSGSNPYNKAGSSPRARGAHVDEPAGLVGWGLIPACAGSTLDGGPYRATGFGSSPRARGAHLLTCRFALNLAVFHSVSRRVCRLRPAFLYRLALLQPARGPTVFWFPGCGRRMRWTPSVSTGSHSWRCTLNASLCSERVE